MKTEKEVTTIEATGKLWKSVMLIGAMMFFIGLATLYVDPAPSYDCARMAAIGLLVYIIGRIGAWWNHG